MDRLDMLVDLVKKIDGKQDKMCEDISEMKVEVALNTKGLTEHMEQTLTIKKMHLDHRDESNIRLKHVEERLTVGYLLKLIMTAIVGSGSIAGSVYGIIKFVDYVTKL